MRHIYFTVFVAILLQCSASGQKNKIIAYAITPEKEGNQVWTEVKLIDLATGQVLQQVFESRRLDYPVFNARNGNRIPITDKNGFITDNQRLPFSGFAAALAFDQRHNRLYYTPMSFNQLRYIDLSSRESMIYYFEGEDFIRDADMKIDANQVTRMVIAADGNGYALSNDGYHLVRFTTTRDPVITDLGPLNDDPDNGPVSIHNRCNSWGGDMVATASGDLLLVSATHQVFRIDIRNKIATYKGSVTGLPANYSSNGVAVDPAGNLVLGSASSTEGYYRVRMPGWEAELLSSGKNVFNTADLANGNLAFQEEVQKPMPPLFSREKTASAISFAPNPVSEGFFRVTFGDQEPGRYQLVISDLLGRTLQVNKVATGNKGQWVQVELEKRIAGGIYFLKVINEKNKTAFSGKFLVN